MKKLHILFITVCCVAAIVSCRKTETPVKPETEPEQKEEKEEKEETKTVLYGSLGETTKTYLSPNGDESQFDVYWEKNDEIAISKDGNNKYAVYQTMVESGEKKVRFDKKSGIDLVVGDVFDAFYPASLVDASTGSLQWPSEQRYKEISTSSSSGAAGNNPMWAHTTVQSGQTVMQFYNLGGVIRFKLSEPTKEFTVVKAMISADQPMSGAFTLQEITLPKTKAMKAVISDGSGDVTITPEGGVTIPTSGAASFYFAVPENTYTGVQITLVGEDGTKVNARLAEGKTLEVKRAEVVRLTANGVTPSMEGSNCFIGEGNVPIVITAMGNAFDGTTALDGNDAKAVWKAIKGNAQGCKIVWETINTATKPADNTIIKSVSFDAKNGVLTVVPTGTPGNALVAITSGTGGTGDIVWSYHIWVPKTGIGKVVINNDNGNFVFLDRNLGALRAADPNVTDNTKSIGLLYQWGRKDPIMGFCDFGNNMMNGLDPTKGSISQGFKNALQNPDKYINAGNSFWHNVGLPYLWGYPVEGSTTGPISKTIYDPCPIGYRVPDDSKFNCLSGLAVTLNNDTLYATSVPLYFPCSGFFSSGGTKYNGNKDYFAIQTAIANGSNSTENWNLKISNNKFSIDRSGAYAYTGIVKSVRCVRDDTQSPASEGYTLIEMSHEHINFFE